jgi:hypothetical protein
MQTFVRRILGFVTQVLAPAPVDTTASDQAWWEQEVAESLGDWYMEEVSTSCVSCGTVVRISRWQVCSEGDECNSCIQLDATRYEADEDEINAAFGVKISL